MQRRSNSCIWCSSSPGSVATFPTYVAQDWRDADQQYPKWQQSRRLRIIVPVGSSLATAVGRSELTHPRFSPSAFYSAGRVLSLRLLAPGTLYPVALCVRLSVLRSSLTPMSNEECAFGLPWQEVSSAPTKVAGFHTDTCHSDCRLHTDVWATRLYPCPKRARAGCQLYQEGLMQSDTSGAQPADALLGRLRDELGFYT